MQNKLIHHIAQNFVLLRDIGHLKDTKGLTKNEKDFSRKWKTTSKMVTEDTIKAPMDGIKGKFKNFVKTYKNVLILYTKEFKYCLL